MAIKASVTITISCYRDTKSITRYYKLQSSTLATPTKPTANPPSGWSDAEPSYTSGSTNTLYLCDLIVFSDDTFMYSAVSKSSSYEAAKEAWNKANNAQNTANKAQASVDNLKVGGRNYIQLTKLKSYTSYNTTPVVTNGVITTTFNAGKYFSLYVDGYKPPDGICTVSGYIQIDGAIPTTKFFTGLSSTYGSGLVSNTYDSTTGYFSITQKYPGNSQWIFHCPTSTITGTTAKVSLTKLKFEIGHKATDWTLSPEDIDLSIDKVEQKADSAKDFTDKAKNNFGYQYKYDITINGDSSTYYPVILRGGNQNVMREIMVQRGYGEKAPTDWEGHPSLKGISLLLKIKCNYGGWGGANYSWWIHDLEECYGNVFAGANRCMANMGFYIYLRGGGDTGAIYHIYSDQALETTQMNGTSPIICYNSERIGWSGGTSDNPTYSWNAPAPVTLTEDILNAIAAKKYINVAANTADGLEATTDAMEELASKMNERIESAELTINKIDNLISTLVVDANGGSLMKQTSDGWIFSMGETLAQLQAATDDLKALQEELGVSNGNIESLQNIVTGLETLTSYIRISTDGDEPCLELGNESSFKLLITNTAIKFMDGTSVPAYVTNQSLKIGKAEVEDELVFGGFAFSERSNGNMGLIWKGDDT